MGKHLNHITDNLRIEGSFRRGGGHHNDTGPDLEQIRTLGSLNQTEESSPTKIKIPNNAQNTAGFQT